MKKMLVLLALAAPLVLFASADLHTQQAPSPAEVERRVTSLASQLRCLVCQNQSLAESDAPLARDLKERVREQVARGSSDEQIRAYMVERYGDFVLYQPPFKPATWLLWLGPFALLLLGFAALFARLKRQRDEQVPLSEQELQRAARLLEDEPQGDGRR